MWLPSISKLELSPARLFSSGDSGVDGNTDALNVLSQVSVRDVIESLDLKAVGQRQIIQFLRDGLTSQGINGTPKGQIYIGLRAVVALGTGAEKTNLRHLGMTAKDARHQVGFMFSKGWWIHA